MVGETMTSGAREHEWCNNGTKPVRSTRKLLTCCVLFCCVVLNSLVVCSVHLRFIYFHFSDVANLLSPFDNKSRFQDSSDVILE